MRNSKNLRELGNQSALETGSAQFNMDFLMVRKKKRDADWRRSSLDNTLSTRGENSININKSSFNKGLRKSMNLRKGEAEKSVTQSNANE